MNTTPLDYAKPLDEVVLSVRDVTVHARVPDLVCLEEFVAAVLQDDSQMEKGREWIHTCPGQMQTRDTELCRDPSNERGVIKSTRRVYVPLEGLADWIAAQGGDDNVAGQVVDAIREGIEAHLLRYRTDLRVLKRKCDVLLELQVRASKRRRLASGHDLLTMAYTFMMHVINLYSNEAPYMPADSCFMRLENPTLTFSWVNVGLMEDRFVILGSTSALKHVFDFLNEDYGPNGKARIWDKSHETWGRAEAMLIDYFRTVPQCDLVIDAWGPDGTHQFPGGRIGASTGYKWIEEPKPIVVDSDEDDK